MKKYLSLIAIQSVLLITGCGNEDKLTCSKKKEIGKSILNTEVVTVFKDNYATKTNVKIEAECETEEIAKAFAKQYEGKEGHTVKIDKDKVIIKYSTKVAKENKTSDENKDTQVKNYYENEGYTCK